eukprot:7167543-Prymnesium_polylepis.1
MKKEEQEEQATLKKPLTDKVSLDSSMLALQDILSGKTKPSDEDFTGLMVPLMQKLDDVLPEDTKHILRNLLSSRVTTESSAATALESADCTNKEIDMSIVRRRLIDWLVINTSSQYGRTVTGFGIA